MNYKVHLIKSTEGYVVMCPAMPGCCGQGATREEALANIRDGIRLWLEVVGEDIQRAVVLEEEEVGEVTV